MENNEYNPSPTDRGSMDDAIAALSAVNESEVQAREAARPPQWHLIGTCVCLGAMVGASGLPGQGWTIVLSLVTLAQGLLLVRSAQTRRASPSGLGLFKPLRAYLIPYVIFLVLLLGTILWSSTPGMRALLPWWGYLVLGLVVGVTMYVVTDWSWGKWVHRR